MAGNRTLNYGRMMQRALRGLMADVLGEVAENGLPGDHHFYIGIDTTHPGVDIPGWLKARHPKEMTIVLQEWFEDLAVLSDRFTVTLSFSGQAQTVVVPFEAVQTFIDPSVKFGLKFDEEQEPEDVEFDGADPDEEDDGDGNGDDPAPGGGTDGGSEGGGGSADVVSLDKFRRS